MPVAAEPTEDGAAFRIQAVDRAVLLLKSVATSTTPPTVLELARACGINRSTAWRLLRTLEYHGLIDRDPVTQRYTVGYGAITIAQTRLNSRGGQLPAERQSRRHVLR